MSVVDVLVAILAALSQATAAQGAILGVFVSICGMLFGGLVSLLLLNRHVRRDGYRRAARDLSLLNLLHVELEVLKVDPTVKGRRITVAALGLEYQVHRGGLQFLVEVDGWVRCCDGLEAVEQIIGDHLLDRVRRLE